MRFSIDWEESTSDSATKDSQAFESRHPTLKMKVPSSLKASSKPSTPASSFSGQTFGL